MLHRQSKPQISTQQTDAKQQQSAGEEAELTYEILVQQ
jgi:hypothetical protein